jgi:hypothetical protein
LFDLYASDCDGRWRFVLGQSGACPLYVIGLNPSTATQERADTTIAKVVRVARQHGYEGFVMLNLYPVRATDCRTLPVKPDPQAYCENLDQIERIIGAAKAPVIWAAWGSGIRIHDYFLSAVHTLAVRLQPFAPTWIHFGSLTKAGHPRHPSRLAYAWRFASFDCASYARRLRDLCVTEDV